MLLSVKKVVGDEEMAATSKGRQKVGSRASIVGIAINTLLCVAKAAIGLAAGSISIVADAVNNLADAASNVISLFGFKLAGKPADADHPYGHGRYEYLAGLTVAVLVLVVGVELARGSVDKLLNPSPVEFSGALVVVLVLSIAVKLWMMLFNSQVGKAIGSGTLEAAAVDSRNDMITTGAVLAAAVASRFIGFDLDGWMGLIVAAFILWSGVGLIREAIDPLLGKPADPELLELIEKKTLATPGILGIHDVLVHDYGPGRVFASFHAEVPAEVDVLESHEIIDDLEVAFLKDESLPVTIHLDPIVTSDSHVGELRSWISEDVKSIDPLLTIHDLRIVPGENHINVLFDCFEPYSCTIAEDDLKKQIAQRVAAQFPHHFCIIHIDHG